VLPDGIDLVRGKKIERVAGLALRREAAAAERVVVDLGAGDGRWIFRIARAHPAWFCVGVDANAAGMRETARRAGRKPARGGAPNAWFLRAMVAALPAALEGLADEVHVHLPWGSLLRAVVAPEPETLRRIARLCRSGATVCVRVNASILDDPAVVARLSLPAAGKQSLEARLTAAYAAAGIQVAITQTDLDLATSWARRLGAGRPMRVLAIDGTVIDPRGNEWPHGGVEAVRWYKYSRSEVPDEA